MTDISLLPELATFLAHWKNCCEPGHIVPTVQGWLQRLTGPIALRSFRVELTDTDAIVQFIGSANASALRYNSTGLSVFHGNPERREIGMVNFRRVVQHPCGLVTEATMLGETPPVQMQAILLPLRVEAGRRPQIVSATISRSVLGSDTKLQPDWKMNETQWIDIGGGAPDQLPR